jgi:hypothetical protein
MKGSHFKGSKAVFVCEKTKERLLKGRAVSLLHMVWAWRGVCALLRGRGADMVSKEMLDLFLIVVISRDEEEG